MKTHNRKRGRRLAVLFSVVLAFSVLLTGCLDTILYLLEDEDEGNLWDDVGALEAEYGDNWWDHPGEGGTSAEDWAYDGDLEWWNVLDDSWSLEDWEPLEEGVWVIYDEETECAYIYDEEYQQFGAMDVETEDTYLLDMETGEWIPMD